MIILNRNRQIGQGSEKNEIGAVHKLSRNGEERNSPAKRENPFKTCATMAILVSLFAWAAWPVSRAQTTAPSGQGSSKTGAGPVLFPTGSDVAEIPADFIGNQVFVPVRVNRTQPSLFRLDSSDSTTSISPARLAEVAPPVARTTMLNFAGFDFPTSALPAVDKKDFAAQVGRTYEGTLGNDFLSCVIAEIDYGRQTLRIYDPGSYVYTGNGKKFPLTFVGTLPVIRAKITLPKGKPFEADFVLNTALDAGVVISNRYATAHHLPSLKTIPADDPQLSADQGAVATRVKTFQIGEYAVEGAVAEFSSAEMPFGDNNKIADEIGGGLLRRFTVILDYPHQQVILAPNVHFNEDDHEDMSGLSLIALGPGLKTFQVTQVAPGSVAAHEGIQAGDVLIGIDQDPAADLTLEQFLDLFQQVGHKYKLVISHNGQTREVTLEMRRRL